MWQSGKFSVNELEIVRLGARGYSPTRIANMIGSTPEAVKSIQQEFQSVAMRKQGWTDAEIAQALDISESQAKVAYSRGHNRFRQGQQFPSDVFKRPTVVRDTNRNNPQLLGAIKEIGDRLPKGYAAYPNFEPDSMGGRYVVRIVNETKNQSVGQPFRLTSTQQGTLLVSKTGVGPGGYRKTQVGLNNDPTPLVQSIANATNEMIRSDRANKKTSIFDSNHLDVTNQKGRQVVGGWKRIDASHSTMALAGQYKEEHVEVLVKGTYPKGAKPSYVYGSGVYPIEARTMIPGNVSQGGTQFSSQAKLGKVVKRDNLTLNRKYDIWGPAPGVAYPTQKQHIMGQNALGRETAVPMKALVLAGNVIPEGQMWTDRTVAGHTWKPFAQNQEKFAPYVGADWTEKEVLSSLGLLDADGNFKPRRLRPGQKVRTAPGGTEYDYVGNNDYAMITGVRIEEVLDKQGNTVRRAILEGFQGNSTNVTAAFKFQGHKHLSTDKDIRGQMGIDADFILNKPSDPRVAMMNSLNALPRRQLEDLWQRVHGHTNIPERATVGNIKEIAKAYGVLYKENYVDDLTIPGQIMTNSDLKKMMEAGKIKGSVEKLAPAFEGAEPMYRADIKARGAFLPVGARMVTDVTDPRKGYLSNDAIRSLDTVLPGLGTELFQRGDKSRRIYHALYETNRLNTDPNYKASSPVVDVLKDIKSKAVREQIRLIQGERLGDLLPEGIAQKFALDQTLDPREGRIYNALQKKARAEAIQTYYERELGTSSFIMKLGSEKLDQVGPRKGSHYILNPAETKHFGYIDEAENRVISKLTDETQKSLQHAWDAMDAIDRGRKGTILKSAQMSVLAAAQGSTLQEDLLRSKATRKKWFGSTDRSIITHVHGSDFGVPRNAGVTSWENINKLFGIPTHTKEGRALANKLAQQGRLRFGGGRNPFSDPLAQLDTVLNMLTPDIAKSMGLDLNLKNNAIVFHPEMVMRQGGDNDSDMSQIFGITTVKDGKATNKYPLTSPEKITQDAIRHSSGEYQDAIEKLMVSKAQAIQDTLGFPQGKSLELGKGITEKEISQQTLRDAQLNAAQIGQAYNYPIRVGINLSQHTGAKRKISQWGGTIYQNPLDKKNYPEGSPEAELFAFLSTFNPALRNYKTSSGAFRNPAFGEDIYAFGAGKLVNSLLEMTSDKAMARMLPEEFAAMVVPNYADDATNRKMRQAAIDVLKKNPEAFLNQKWLEKFSQGDSPAAQILRGYGVINAEVGARQFQRITMSKKAPNIHATRNYAKNIQELYQKGKLSSEHRTMFEAFMSDMGLDPKSNLFTYLDPGKKGTREPGQFHTLHQIEQGKFYKGLGNLVGSIFPSHPALESGGTDANNIKDLMAISAKKGSFWEPSLNQLSRIMSKFMPRAMAQGDVVDRPTHALLGEAGEREFVVPASKTKAIGGLRVFDPTSLGKGSGYRNVGGRRTLMLAGGLDMPDWMEDAPPPPGTLSEKEYNQGHRQLNSLRDKLVLERGGYALGEAMGKIDRPAPIMDRPSLPTAPPSQIIKEITSYAQPFSEKLVQKYELLASRLEDYTGSITQMSKSGASLNEAQGELASVISAATDTFHRFEGQSKRAGRILKQAGLEAKLRSPEGLNERESKMLDRLKESHPTRISEVEKLHAQRALSAINKIQEKTGSEIGGSVYAMAADIGGRDRRKTPPGFGEKMRKHYQREFNAQTLFFQSQALAQSYYMLGLPLMQAREGYIQSEFGRGQMLAALGQGGMPENIKRIQAQQAAGANFATGVGQGVYEAVDPLFNMVANWQGQSEDFAPAVGKGLTYGLGGITGGMLAKKFGLFALGKAGLGKLGAGLGGTAASGVVLPAAAVLGGVLAGGGIYNKIKDEDDLTAGQIFRQGISLPALMLGDKSLEVAKKTGLITPEQSKARGDYVGNIIEAFGQQGFKAAGQAIIHRDWREEKPSPTPVEIDNIDDFAKEFANSFTDAKGDARIDTDSARAIITAFAETTGLKDIQSGVPRNVLEKITLKSLDTGVPPEQLIKYIGQVPKAAGMMPGSKQALPILEYLSGFKSMTDLEGMMQSLQAVAPMLQNIGRIDLAPSLAKEYRSIADQRGTVAAKREMQWQMRGSPYAWSAAAYRAGTPELAMMDEYEPWRYRGEREMQTIQDRQRRYKVERDLGVRTQQRVMLGSGGGITEWAMQDTWSGGREAQQIGWMQDKFDLEQKFWDFRRKRQAEDFTLGQKQFDLTRRQMLWNIEREEKQAEAAKNNYKEQYAIQKQMFDLQTGWKQEDFAIQGSRLETQRAWQLQDFQTQSTRFEETAGWQVEDIDEAIRFSTGRQRRKLKKQRERLFVQQAWKEQDLATVEERAKTKYEWSKDDLAREKERFETIRPLQAELLKLQFEYWQMNQQLGDEDRAKRKGFMLEQLALMEEQNASTVENYAIQRQLDEEQHALDAAIAQTKIQWGLEDLENARLVAVEQETILGLQRQRNEAQQIYNATQALGIEKMVELAGEDGAYASISKFHAAWIEDLEAINAKWNSINQSAATVASYGMPHPGLYDKEFAAGGPVNRPTIGLLGEAGQEYVVPSGGALVMRSSSDEKSDQMITLLTIIASAMQSGARIVIDADALRESGFVHVDDFNKSY
jgi:hypothetical protein